MDDLSPTPGFSQRAPTGRAVTGLTLVEIMVYVRGDFMDSNLVQLAAYVIIILVIGGASVIKKMIEARNRRQEMEKLRGKTLRLDLEQPSQPEVQTAARIEEAEREIVIESEPEPESSAGKPKIEDILKELFNIPTVPQKQPPVIKNIPRTLEETPRAFERPQMSAAAVDESVSGQAETITSSNEPNWEVFAAGLKSRELTEIQRAIVMSELIQKPRTRRMGR